MFKTSLIVFKYNINAIMQLHQDDFHKIDTYQANPQGLFELKVEQYISMLL